MKPILGVLLASVAVLAACSRSNPAGLSPSFREAITGANKTVHEDFPARTVGENASGTFDQAVADARASLLRAKNQIRNSNDENTYLILLNCFFKDKERYQRQLLQREGTARSDTPAEITLLEHDHQQCSVEFRRWTAESSDTASPGGGNACLAEARKARDFLESPRN